MTTANCSHTISFTRHELLEIYYSFNTVIYFHERLCHSSNRPDADEKFIDILLSNHEQMVGAHKKLQALLQHVLDDKNNPIYPISIASPDISPAVPAAAFPHLPDAVATATDPGPDK